MYLPENVKEEIQANIQARLKKIEGQIRGLQAMVKDSRECDQILTQVRAAQSALEVGEQAGHQKLPYEVLRGNQQQAVPGRHAGKTG